MPERLAHGGRGRRGRLAFEHQSGFEGLPAGRYRSPERGGHPHRILRLRSEHQLERRHLVGLRHHLEGAVYGDPLSLDFFVDHARRYLDLQRTHMAWEERLLIPLARMHLDAEEDAEMLAGFRRIEAEHRPGAFGQNVPPDGEHRVGDLPGAA